jgi:hypothetical protein
MMLFAMSVSRLLPDFGFAVAMNRVVPVRIAALSSSAAISSVTMLRCAKIQDRWNTPSDGSRTIQKQLTTRIASANPGGARHKLRRKAYENVVPHVSSGGIDKRRHCRRSGRRRTDGTGIPTGKHLRGEA